MNKLASMDTQSLQAFLCVAECSSFSGAAEQLHLTQPAISKRIATLEKQLNARLFDRIGRHIHLTEAGRALLPEAQRILQDIREARRRIDDLRGSVSGRLSMGISHHIGLHRLPPVLRELSTSWSWSQNLLAMLTAARTFAKFHRPFARQPKCSTTQRCCALRWVMM